MTKLLGLLTVFLAVFGGYWLASGKLLALWQPFEIIIIVGAAMGAFVIANPLSVVKDTFKGVGSVFRGSEYGRNLYLDLLLLLFRLFGKVRREGLIALERDIDDPKSSKLFRKHIYIMRNKEALEFITDYMRLVIIGDMSAYELESLMETEIDNMHKAKLAPVDALYKSADALPGFGIVAAVLGIVITMQALGGEPEELGYHIAAALVGTFIGIFLAYGVVGPLASALEQQVSNDVKFFECIKSAIVASINGVPPQVAVEFARKSMSVKYRPGFNELEKRIRST
ncbi:MAG: flagellar motor stator protein MotA [Pseudomonadota bacterium]